MLKETIVKTVRLCADRPWLVVIVAALVAVGAATYAAKNFALTSDINELISQDLDWRQREIAFSHSFPQQEQLILAVIQAPTPELADQAADRLGEKLSTDKVHFRSVRRPDGGPFFERNGWLYLPTAEVARNAAKLVPAKELIGHLAADPSLRGVAEAISSGITGVQIGRITIDDLARPFSLVADTLDDVLASRPASFSWRVLLNGKPASPSELRRFIEIRPVLDFGDLEPGLTATEAIRKAVADLNLAHDYRANVRLTGPVPLSDDEFGSLKENAVFNTAGTILVVLLILWLALRSFRIIAAVFLSLMVGLAVTAALGLMMVGALNVISIAFAVLFVGLGVDFGIQFSVRYRAERYDHDDLQEALLKAGSKLAAPLTLAAAAVAAGFLSFLPTDYLGLSELGLIAGVGMLVAFFTSITVLPALLKLFNTPGEPIPVGYKALAPVDRFLERHRIPIVVITLLVAIGGLPLLYHLKFDFNPLNMRNPKVESVATFLDLRKDPNSGINAIDILAPSLAKADDIAARVAKLPEVSRVMTLSSFIPQDQDAKLATIAKAKAELSPALTPAKPAQLPTDAQNVDALKDVADDLAQSTEADSPGARAAKRLSDLFSRLAQADAAKRAAAEAAIVKPLKVALAQLRRSLDAERVTLQTLPADIRADWMTPDGRARVQVMPKGDPNDNEVLRQFVAAVTAVEPTAVGTPVSIQKSGDTIVRAFIHAGLFALAAIMLLLWITLRRFGDVLLTLVPLLLAGILSLEICVLIGMPLNFANIIALPLMLGIGVAFKIYYVMAWRAGQTGLLQSSLTRAVIFSALTTATAFGSLWLSSHPGTSSMGKLLALSLLTTMCAAVLFQPALMGKPRDTAGEELD